MRNKGCIKKGGKKIRMLKITYSFFGLKFGSARKELLSIQESDDDGVKTH